MKPIKFRTQAACRIARIDRDRFNEAVAAGNYPCAPETARGSARVFDFTALICLIIYGRLLDQGELPNRAGFYACKVAEVLMYARGEREVTIATGSGGSTEAYGLTDEQEGPRRILSGGLYVVSRLSFDIENIRKIIEREIEEELSIAGEDD